MYTLAIIQEGETCIPWLSYRKVGHVYLGYHTGRQDMNTLAIIQEGRTCIPWLSYRKVGHVYLGYHTGRQDMNTLAIIQEGETCIPWLSYRKVPNQFVSCTSRLHYCSLEQIKEGGCQGIYSPTNVIMHTYTHAQLPSFFMPILMHLMKRQRWHEFRVNLLMTQFPVSLQEQSKFFCTVRLKKPLHPSHEKTEQ